MHDVGMGLFEEIELLRRERDAAFRALRVWTCVYAVWMLAQLGVLAWAVLQ